MIVPPENSEVCPSWPPAVDDNAQALLEHFQQGDVIDVEQLAVTTSDGHRVIQAPHGAVVLSQTCDLVQQNRFTAQLALLVRLSSGDAKAARSGRRPRFVLVPGAGEGDMFADLEFVSTISKVDLAKLKRTAGISSHREQRVFAQRIGRRFTRFPFPDEVQPWLRPLEELLEKKAGKTESAEGKVLQDIIEVRVESEYGWAETGPPYDLTITFLLDDVLPDDYPEMPESLRTWLGSHDGSSQRGASEIAQKLLSTQVPSERTVLYDALAEVWANRCRAALQNSDPAVAAAVASLRVEVVSTSDYTVDRMYRSEPLDLDYLSPPKPL